MISLRADQALEVASLLRFFQALQLDLKAAIKQDGDWYKRFMPLSELTTSSLHWESNITAFLILHGTGYMYVGDEYGSLTTSIRSQKQRASSLLLTILLLEFFHSLVQGELEDRVVLVRGNKDLPVDGKTVGDSQEASHGGAHPDTYLPPEKWC